MTSEITMKSVIAGLSVFALDKFFLREPEMQNSIILGVSTAIGVYGADMVGKVIPDNFKTSFVNGQTIETRVLEIGGSTAVVAGISQYVGRPIANYNLVNKIGIIVASDIIGSYAAEYIEGKPLSFLQ
jgi:5,10-methylene-tetrahydrofolate dehydrogenase/methenyl tetrahydrofolate cyclohydrolase